MSDFTDLVDLAAKRLGGMVLAANDEFFAPKENLLEPAPPVFDPHRYTDRGKEMDGWETRRRRGPGHDWALVRLGAPGVVRGVVVDTTHFRGNYPQGCAIEGCAADDEALLSDPQVRVEWVSVLPRTPLAGDTAQRFAVDCPYRVTHLRLSIYPDGGVARLRVHGEVVADLRALARAGGLLDLAAAVNGGQVSDCSEEFFSSRHNLVAPGDARDMGDGWETRRRRGPGNDWVVVTLATRGVVERVEVDTTHYKGNFPDSCSVEARDAGDDDLAASAWRPLVGRSRLGPHARHVFAPADSAPATHVRFNIFPDGGVARLRLLGRVDDDGWWRLGVRRLNALLPGEAETQLRDCCASQEWARRMTQARPFADIAALEQAADDTWADLEPTDWLEAFAAHPRIGERATSTWSREEQSGTAEAAAETLQALVEGNRAYEERFGHTFLVCATGKTAEQMLAALHERLGNDPETELHVAAEEQRKITRLRLDKLMRP